MMKKCEAENVKETVLEIVREMCEDGLEEYAERLRAAWTRARASDRAKIYRIRRRMDGGVTKTVTKTVTESVTQNAAERNPPPTPPIKRAFKEFSNPPRSRDAGATGGFEEFWKSYPDSCPRKTDKRKCLDEYLRLRTLAPDADAFQKLIMEGLARWKDSELWRKDGGSFIRSPYRWLRSESWNDRPKKAEGSAAGGSTIFRDENYVLRLGVR